LGERHAHCCTLPQERGVSVKEPVVEPVLALMHNDAVVQGLSDLPSMAGVDHWAILTIGTGLGNATFANSSPRRAGLAVRKS
jgi:hypothetical protein